MKVHVLVISTKHGEDVNVFATPELASQGLYEYVKEYWTSDGPGRDGEPLPDDHDAATQQYFEYASHEYFISDVADVQGAGFRVDIAGTYGVNDGTIHLLDGDEEIVMWDSAEWAEDPSLVYVIANAMRLGYTEGAGAVAG